MAHSEYYAQIDRYAYTNKIAKCSPITKAFFALTTLVVTVCAQSIIVPLIVLSTLTALTLGYVRIKARFYVKLLAYPTFMLALTCILLALFWGDGQSLVEVPFPWFTLGLFKAEGISIALNTFFRVQSALSCLFFLVLTTTITDLSIILRRARVPRVLVEMSMLIYRYIFVFLEVAEQMSVAQKLRLGEGGWLKRIRGLALLASNLFIRTLEQGERTFVAMSARGYDGDIRVLEDLPTPSKAMIAAILVFEICLVVVIFLTINIGVFW
ncbi:MAG: cobalt ECF transporter T component CbiQ [Candidatus Bathyarchaeia archaeon]|jgi:cobalt/nickel transport system permease protein